MTLLDEFLVRENIDRRLTDAATSLARATAAIAATERCAGEMAAILEEARPHLEALRGPGRGRTEARETAK